MNSPRRFIQLISGLIIAAGLAAMIWSLWPLPSASESLTLNSDLLAIPGSGAKLEGRTIRLEYPAELRRGEIGQVSMILTPNPASAAREAKVNVEAEAWLDLPGAGVLPGDMTSTAVLAGRTNRFDWVIRPGADQNLEGRAWLYFHLIPTNGSVDQRKPVSAQPLTVRVVSLAGLDEGMARWAGAGAILAGLVGAGWGVVWGKRRIHRMKKISIK